MPMRCKINPKYRCGEIWKTGKGAWDTNDPCAKCGIFRDTKQTQLKLFARGERNEF
jgi:hypothetical protein